MSLIMWNKVFKRIDPVNAQSSIPDRATGALTERDKVDTFSQLIAVSKY